MSGTSLDGVDVALIETDGEASTSWPDRLSYAVSDDERAVLRQALAEAVALTDRDGAAGRGSRGPRH